jgi:hypothetical protein
MVQQKQGLQEKECLNTWPLPSLQYYQAQALVSGMPVSELEHDLMLKAQQAGFQDWMRYIEQNLWKF